MSTMSNNEFSNVILFDSSFNVTIMFLQFVLKLVFMKRVHYGMHVDREGLGTEITSWSLSIFIVNVKHLNGISHKSCWWNLYLIWNLYLTNYRISYDDSKVKFHSCILSEHACADLATNVLVHEIITCICKTDRYSFCIIEAQCCLLYLYIIYFISIIIVDLLLYYCYF